MLISERIYKYIAERGLSQIEFSKRTGISQSTISDWRRKGTNPSSDKIMVICDVLEITPLELLTGVDSSSQDNTDFVVLNKNSAEYQLVETYRQLGGDARKRVEGYMAALKDMM
jgi:transcriptional regulator with XRE-family HTH domain